MREIVNGIFYVMRAGCPWRLLPNDLPPWGTILDLCTFERRACGVSLFEECSVPREATPKTEIGSWYLRKIRQPNT